MVELLILILNEARPTRVASSRRRFNTVEKNRIHDSKS